MLAPPIPPNAHALRQSLGQLLACQATGGPLALRVEFRKPHRSTTGPINAVSE